MTEPERLRVNPIACDAHGLCADLFPEMIQLDEWGYPVLDGRDVPEQLLGHARRAVAACPTLALALVRRPTPAAPAGPRPAAVPVAPARPLPGVRPLGPRPAAVPVGRAGVPPAALPGPPAGPRPAEVPVGPAGGPTPPAGLLPAALRLAPVGFLPPVPAHRPTPPGRPR